MKKRFKKRWIVIFVALVLAGLFTARCVAGSGDLPGEENMSTELRQQIDSLPEYSSSLIYHPNPKKNTLDVGYAVLEVKLLEKDPKPGYKCTLEVFEYGDRFCFTDDYEKKTILVPMADEKFCDSKVKFVVAVVKRRGINSIFPYRILKLVSIVPEEEMTAYNHRLDEYLGDCSDKQLLQHP